MKRIKKLLCTLLCISMIFACAACGKDTKEGDKDSKGSEGTGKNQGIEYVYVPSYQKIEVEKDGYISGVRMDSKKCLYGVSVYSYEEGTEQNTFHLVKVDFETGESTKIPVVLDEGGYIAAMDMDSEGNIWILESIYQYDKITYETLYEGYYIVRYDEKGTELNKFNLDDLMKEQDPYNSYIQNMAIDKDGYIHLKIGDSVICVLNPDGSKKVSLTASDWVDGLSVAKDGKVYTSMYGMNGMEIRPVDAENMKFGDAYQGIGNLHGAFFAGLNYDIIYNGESALMGYNMGDKTSTSIANWLDCGISSNNIEAVAELENGDYMLFSRSYEGESESVNLIRLVKTDKSTLPDVTEVVIGSYYASDTLKEQILKFNKENPEYKITIKEYNQNAITLEDYESAIVEFNNDIISGNVLDMVDLSSIDNVNSLVSKGALEDLTTYLENDPQINLDDYVSNVLTSYKVDGKLISLVTSFSINTMMGKPKFVGNEAGWTIKDMMALADSVPAGTEILPYATKEMILYSMIMYSVSDFYNTETGECYFNSDNFVNLLEFANRFPMESEYNEDDESEPSKIARDALLLLTTQIWEVEEYQLYNLMFGGDMTCIGYPTTSGNGNMITSGSELLAICSKSDNKDIAWEFMKTLLQEDYQRNQWMGFPVLESVLQEKYDKAMEVIYYTDENGEKVEEPHTTWGWNGVNFEIYAATKEEIDELDALIRSLDTFAVSVYDEQVFEIIQEEATYYFEGAKSAKDVADVIQNRVFMYIQENY